VRLLHNSFGDPWSICFQSHHKTGQPTLPWDNSHMSGNQWLGHKAGSQEANSAINAQMQLLLKPQPIYHDRKFNMHFLNNFNYCNLIHAQVIAFDNFKTNYKKFVIKENWMSNDLVWVLISSIVETGKYDMERKAVPQDTSGSPGKIFLDVAKLLVLHFICMWFVYNLYGWFHYHAWRR